MNKKYFLYAIIPAVMLMAVGGAVLADSKINKIDPMANIVNAIAQKFNLNVNDVQAVFDQQRTEMQAQREQNRTQMQEEMNQKFTERINKLVSDGKLTQDQANKIFAKKTELEAQRAGLEGKTKEEIQSIMKASMESLKQWAQDNNIPLGYIQFGGLGMPGKGGMQGHGCPMMGENQPEQAD